MSVSFVCFMFGCVGEMSVWVSQCFLFESYGVVFGLCWFFVG